MRINTVSCISSCSLSQLVFFLTHYNAGTCSSNLLPAAGRISMYKSIWHVLHTNQPTCGHMWNTWLETWCSPQAGITLAPHDRSAANQDERAEKEVLWQPGSSETLPASHTTCPLWSTNKELQYAKVHNWGIGPTSSLQLIGLIAVSELAVSKLAVSELAVSYVVAKWAGIEMASHF